jgi:hypothetical protein
MEVHLFETPCIYLDSSLARQPCPAALPSSLARQPCPADLPARPARQPCPAALPGSLSTEQSTLKVQRRNAVQLRINAVLKEAVNF